MASRKKTSTGGAAARTAAPKKAVATATAKAAPKRAAKAPGKPNGNGHDEQDPAFRRVGGKLPTGSLHTQAREPQGAKELKAKLTAALNAAQQLKKLKGKVARNFYAIGHILSEVRAAELHRVKGYTTLEDFAEREAGLSPQGCTASLRIFDTFLPETASSTSFTKLSAAIRAIDETPDTESRPKALSRGARSPIPPHKL